ncbi:HERC1 [Symbiodinium natans]|uniref:HERC1 protein n=1 Tax=Symbiodinium natans TaxID=878477 RepID=A0A812V3L3_9DINO|nr:HERC1 [Symbiodinium natans]
MVVFSSSSCPFCQKALAALRDAGYSPKVVEDFDRSALGAKCGSTSVPKVFVKQNFIGGCNDGGMGGTLPLLKNGKIKEQTIRIEYSEPGSLNKGEFDLVKISSWNGHRIVTKTYGNCKVDYSVTCVGKTVALVLEDSCGSRSDSRSISEYRQTKLHTSSFTMSHFMRDPDKEIELHLPIKKRLVMRSDGSRVIFRRIQPLSLEEQLKNPSQLRFFASVPRLASCLPEPGDDIFRTSKNTSSFSAQKCSACHNFLESGLKDMGPCTAAETIAGRVRCHQFAGKLKKEDEGVLETLKHSMEHRGNDLTIELAWQLGCQDLGCCPLDPDTAEMLATQATHSQAVEQFAEADRARRKQELKDLKTEGLAEHVLDDPSKRRQLEVLLKMKAGYARKQLKLERQNETQEDSGSNVSSPTVDIVASHAKVPVEDEDCRWNYRKSRCEPKYACVYKFRFGDYQLGHSCRLKVDKFRPTSDEDCLWDYKEVRCRNPQFCSRQCNIARDRTLDMCCKLRKNKTVEPNSEEPEMATGTTTSIPIDGFEEDVDDEIGLQADPEDEGPLSDEDDRWLNEIVRDLAADDDIGLEADSEQVEQEESHGENEDIGLGADESETDDGNAGEKGGEDEGNCRSQSDRTILKGSDVPAQLEKIGTDSWRIYRIVREKSLKLHQERFNMLRGRVRLQCEELLVLARQEKITLILWRVSRSTAHLLFFSAAAFQRKRTLDELDGCKLNYKKTVPAFALGGECFDISGWTLLSEKSMYPCGLLLNLSASSACTAGDDEKIAAQLVVRSSSALLESELAEEFFDVPDVVERAIAVRRDLQHVLLQWKAPRDNNRCITHYAVRAWPWQLAVQGSTDVDKAKQVQLTAEDVACGEGDDEDVNCAYLLEALPGMPAAEDRPLLDCQRLPRACWVSVRAANAEGWAEWSQPGLVLFQEQVFGEDAGSAEASLGARLLSWGASEDGRLGRGIDAISRGVCAEADVVPGFNTCRLTSLAAGAHTAAVSPADRLYVWGTFLAEESAGHSVVEEDEEVEMLAEPAVQPTTFVVHDVRCGRFATAVLTAEGSLYAWGPNEGHQCGVPTEAPVVKALTQLKVPRKVPVVQLALGEFHGLALTAEGSVLAWGEAQGPEARLASMALEDPKLRGLLPSSISFKQPEPRLLDIPKVVTAIAAGGYHSAAITEDGMLWTWGSNSYGQLGLDCSRAELPEANAPRPVQFFGHAGLLKAVKVSLGGFHSAVVDEEGALFTFGDNRRGQCGQGSLATLPKPTALPLSGRCVGVSCGGFFSFFEVESESGPSLMVSGWGKEGCLGFGMPCKRLLQPRPVRPPQGSRWLCLRAGVAHVVALVR